MRAQLRSLCLRDVVALMRVRFEERERVRVFSALREHRHHRIQRL